MKKTKCFTVIASITCIFLLSLFVNVQAQDECAPRNYVNDYANVIPQNEEDSLNMKISNYEKTSKVEIAVVTKITLGDQNIDDYCQNLFEKWGIGKAGSDNGILIVVAIQDRQWRIHTGYGVEGVLPDLAASTLAEDLLVPEFREEMYSAGLDKLVTGIMDKIGTEDIEIFKQQQALKQAEIKQKIKRTIIWIGSMLGIFAVLGLVFSLIYKQYNKYQKLKTNINNAKDVIKQLIYTTALNLEGLNTKYSKNMLDEVGELRDTFEKLGDKNNAYTLYTLDSIRDKLNNYVTVAKNYNNSIKVFKDSNSYMKRIKNSLSKINELNEYLKEYGVTPERNFNEDYANELLKRAEVDLNSEKFTKHINMFVEHVNNIEKFQKDLNSTKSRIPLMIKELHNYKSTLSSWINKLQSYGLTSAITKVNESAEKLEPSLSNIKNAKLFRVYGLFIALIAFASKACDEAEYKIRRKKEEEEEKKEEEERAERRRRSSSSYGSGYGSGSSYSSRSSSSSFGGFGGGHSGGGGARGGW
jgi:uncharacterized membrane protein YgcG